MNARKTISLICIVLLGLSVANFFLTFRGSPAFNKSVRQEGLFGDWRVGIGAAHYDRPAYLFRLGYEYLNADATASGVTESRNELASAETALERAEKAVALFEESLSLDPANAHAWAALAWAHAMTGNIPSARAAMLASWELAPFNKALSIDRLTFMDMLTGPMREQQEIGLSKEELAHTHQDIESARRYRKGELAAILARSTTLTTIATQQVPSDTQH